MNLKNCFTKTLILSCCIACFSCSKDDEPDKPAVSSEEVAFLGGWTVSNLPDRNDFILFLDNNQVYYNGNLYAWGYNDKTGTLATTIVRDYSSEPYIWEVNLITQDAWTAYYVRNGETYTATASQYMEMALATILSNAKWMNANDECSLQAHIYYDSPFFYFNGASSGSPIEVYESPAKNYIEISSIKNPDRVYTLHNPYNIEKAYIVDPDNLKFYPKNITLGK